jgi:hypothetical protein
LPYSFSRLPRPREEEEEEEEAEDSGILYIVFTHLPYLNHAHSFDYEFKCKKSPVVNNSDSCFCFPKFEYQIGHELEAARAEIAALKAGQLGQVLNFPNRPKNGYRRPDCSEPRWVPYARNQLGDPVYQPEYGWESPTSEHD